jgi:hypothetical protein
MARGRQTVMASLPKLFATEGNYMANVILFREPDAEAHAQAETERKRNLFAWADALLHQLGLTAAVAQAWSVEDLSKISLNTDDVDIELAIRAALHPATGQRAEQFAGMRAGALKRLFAATCGVLL